MRQVLGDPRRGEMLGQVGVERALGPQEVKERPHRCDLASNRRIGIAALVEEGAIALKDLTVEVPAVAARRQRERGELRQVVAIRARRVTRESSLGGNELQKIVDLILESIVVQAVTSSAPG